MLSISLETVEQLRQLSNTISAARNSLDQAQIKMNDTYIMLESKLGPHAGQIKDCLVKGNVLYQKADVSSLELKQRVLTLAKQIEDYINTSNDTSLAVDYSKEKEDSKQEKQAVFQGLPVTKQSYHTTFINGEACQIFDHPERVAAWGAYKQGSNSYGIGGTCGLCSCATIMNITGCGYREDDIIAYAKKHRKCSRSGGTTPNDWNDIIKKMGGISSKTGRVNNLVELVPEIEAGKGVIIGIVPSMINENWYGPYDPNGGRHAIVLASVIRDEKTNEIKKYVIIDSNGDTPETACQYIDVQDLQDAFEAADCCVNVTNEVLH